MSEPFAGSRRGDVYRHITDKIAAEIERGAPTFEMPWYRSGETLGRPVNAYTDMAYRGINVLALWVSAKLSGFGSRYWGTYKQWRMLDAQVRKGEHGSIIVFYKEVEREVYGETDEDVSTETRLVAKSSFLFNSDQIDGWRSPDLPATDRVETLDAAHRFIANAKADIRHGGDRAFYNQTGDFVQMPDRERFAGTATISPTESYYATLLHELTHWTGHKARLNRDLGPRFRDRAYAMEELVAELGAAFLCADLRVSSVPRPDHAAYISAWLEALGDDKRALFTAASKAASAADYLERLQAPIRAFSSPGREV